MGSEPATPGAVGTQSGSETIPAFRYSNVAKFVRERAWALMVWMAMAAWTAVLFAVTRDAYLSFRTGRFDLGNMVQAVWSTAHGHPLEVTNGATGEQMVRLGSHVDPFLALLTPLWVLWPSPLSLAFAQIAAVSLGALPVFWLGRLHLGSERAAGLLAFAYLASPWIVWTAMDAIHPVTFAIPLFLFCVWFLETDRIALFAVCAVLGMTTGELMGLAVAALGLWYVLARARRRVGLLIAVVGASWTVIAVTLVVPAFSGGSSVFYGVYGNVGGSPTGVLKTAVTSPETILLEVSQWQDLRYTILLGLPLAGAFLLAPGLALVAFPLLGANVLAGFGASTDPHAHYIAGVIPFLFAATIVGLGRLSPATRVRGAVVVVALSVSLTVILGPWSGVVRGANTWSQERSPKSVAALRRAVALVPEGVPVTSTNRVGSHLSARRYVYSPPVVGRADWIIVGSSDSWSPKVIGGYPDPSVLRAFREWVENSPQWRKVFDSDGVLVFRKVPV